jgi:glycosyltransferase involved in cell wall biosynthesis
VVHPDQMTDFVLDSGPGLFHDRYTIGLWVWHLQTTSSSMADAARMMHEVWTPTSHGSRVASSVFGGPVRGVPIPVGREPSGPGRAALGLPDGFVFACSVDYDNGFARQNPLGAVKAYTAAFSPKDGHHLVIDARHADRYPREHALLVGQADERPDVAIRHGLSSAERDRLLANADCYLSLHRADGGLGSVAKAMSWGTFTVVTATPESLEFQTDQDSGLVLSEPVAVPADEYRYPSGSSWADPDLEHASSLLRSVVGEPDVTAAKVRRGRGVATRRFSPSVAVAAVHARLADIDARLHAGHRNDRISAARVRDHAGGRR